MLSIRSTEFMRVSCACLALVVGACSSGPPPQEALKSLRIGVDLPLSGAESRAAMPALNGVRYYVQTHATLDGYAIRLATADDAAEP
ncbi:MAG TPA: hypothetical protein VKD46_06165, partial [bacterium]|nr:hypothetical protein [bacterium]